MLSCMWQGISNDLDELKRRCNEGKILWRFKRKTGMTIWDIPYEEFLPAASRMIIFTCDSWFRWFSGAIKCWGNRTVGYSLDTDATIWNLLASQGLRFSNQCVSVWLLLVAGKLRITYSLCGALRGTSDCRPKAERWKKSARDFHEINIVTLTSDEKTKAYMTLCDYENQKTWITGYWYSDIPYGISVRGTSTYATSNHSSYEADGKWLRTAGWEYATKHQHDHTESFTVDHDFAHLLSSTVMW